MNPWRGLQGLPAQVWLVCAADFINRAGNMVLTFLAPCLVLERHWSPAMASIALAVYGAARLSCAPFTGPIIDRLGAVRVLKISLFIAGLALVVMPFVAKPLLTFALLAVWAAFAQATGPACMALLAGLAPSEQRRGVFALQRLGANLGMSIGPAVGGFLAHLRYDLLFWCDGLTALAAALFVSVRLPSVGRERQAAKAPRSSSRSAWRDPRVLYVLLSSLPALFVFFQAEGAVSLWVVDGLKFDTRFYGLMFTLNTLLIVAFELPLNLAMSKWPHRPVFMLGAACFAVGFGSLGLAHSAAALFGAVVVWTFGEMIMVPGLADVVASFAPADRRGEYMGLYALTFSVAMAVGRPLGLDAYAYFGPMAMWSGCFGLGLLSVLLLARGDHVMPVTAAVTPPPATEQAE